MATGNPRSISAFVRRLDQRIWRGDTRNMPPWKAGLVVMCRVGAAVLRDVRDGQLGLMAMSLVYTTLLALVPLLAVSFSVLKAFGVHNALEPALLNLLAPLGDKAPEISGRIVDFVDNVKAGVIGSVGVGFLIYTVISLMNKIERAFNYTWHVGAQRSFSKRFSDYLSVILVAPVLVFAAMGLTAGVFSSSLVNAIRDVPLLGYLFDEMTRLSPYLMVVLAFSFFYIFIPNTKVKLRYALAGAIVAGLLWQTLGWGFAFFLANSTRMTAIYSAFATLIIFMIWVYLSWMILLLGSSVAFYMQFPEYRRTKRSDIELSSKAREKIALLLMRLIGSRFYRGETPHTLNSLSRDLRIPSEPIEDVLNSLREGGMISEIEGDEHHYLPARPLDSIRLYDIVKLMREGTGGFPSLQLLPADSLIDDALVRLQHALDEGLGDQTIRDLVEPKRKTAKNGG